MENEKQPSSLNNEVSKKNEAVKETLDYIWSNLANIEINRKNGFLYNQYPRESFLIDSKKIAFSFAFEDEVKIFELRQKELSEQKKPTSFTWSKEYTNQFFSGLLGISIAEPDTNGEKRRDIVMEIKNNVCRYGIKDFLITPDTDLPPRGTREWHLEIFTMPDLNQPPDYYQSLLIDHGMPYQKSDLRDFKNGECEEVKNLVDKMKGHIWDRDFSGGGN